MRAKLNDFGVASVDIAPGSSGQFDVVVDGALAFSRAQTGRFPDDADIAGWIGR